MTVQRRRQDAGHCPFSVMYAFCGRKPHSGKFWTIIVNMRQGGVCSAGLHRSASLDQAVCVLQLQASTVVVQRFQSSSANVALQRRRDARYGRLNYVLYTRCGNLARPIKKV